MRRLLLTGLTGLVAFLPMIGRLCAEPAVQRYFGALPQDYRLLLEVEHFGDQAARTRRSISTFLRKPVWNRCPCGGSKREASQQPWRSFSSKTPPEPTSFLRIGPGRRLKQASA